MRKGNKKNSGHTKYDYCVLRKDVLTYFYNQIKNADYDFPEIDLAKMAEFDECKQKALDIIKPLKPENSYVDDLLEESVNFSDVNLVGDVFAGAGFLIAGINVDYLPLKLAFCACLVGHVFSMAINAAHIQSLMINRREKKVSEDLSCLLYWHGEDESVKGLAKKINDYNTILKINLLKNRYDQLTDVLNNQVSTGFISNEKQDNTYNKAITPSCNLEIGIDKQ